MTLMNFALPTTNAPINTGPPTRRHRGCRHAFALALAGVALATGCGGGTATSSAPRVPKTTSKDRSARSSDEGSTSTSSSTAAGEPHADGSNAGNPTAGGARDHGIQHGPLIVDPGRPTLIAGVIRIDPRNTHIRLIAGTKDPGHGAVGVGQVPTADRPNLLAAFNAGFKMTESNGGWFSEGVTAYPLVNGAASLVVRDNGTATVGVWGRDASMDPHVTAVRQNRTLLVDDGQITPAVGSADYRGVWGKTLHRAVAVPRSGVGVTADGTLLYVAVADASVGDLAAAMVKAGAVRAMEFDINPSFVDAYLYQPGSQGAVGEKLIAPIRHQPTHYLAPQSRDFVEVLSR